MEQFDIVIVGGGIAGASLGAAVGGRRSVLLVEAEDQCGAHSTGRSAAFWHEGYGGAGVAPLTRASRAALDSPTADTTDRSLLTPRGAIHISRTGDNFDIVDGIETRALDRAELEQLVPGLRPEWRFGVEEPGLADIDVAALHGGYLGQIRRSGGQVRTRARFSSAQRRNGSWLVQFEDGSTAEAGILVDAAGAWADSVAAASHVAPIGIAPKRRTMIQLRVGRSGLSRLPMVTDAGGEFYFKGEGDRSIWLSPHDEIESDPCDAAPEEMDIAIAIDRFEQAVDWPVERVERSWAGLRSFSPDRLPVYGFDSDADGFFWCAGQGGFGIQTAPAAAAIGAAILLDEAPAAFVAGIDPAPYDPARFR